MSGSTLTGPKAATCEDWDEETQTSLPGSRKSANVAVKRAQTATPEDLAHAIPSTTLEKYEIVDSGYSSTVGTARNMSPNPKRSGVLKVDPAVPERERKPYLASASPTKPHRQPSIRPQVKQSHTNPRVPKSSPFRHKQGECWVCDIYGEHKDLEELKATGSAPPLSPKVHRQSTLQNHDEDVRATARRMSASRQPRPVSMYETFPMSTAYDNPYAYAPPVMPPGTHWPPPMGPAPEYHNYTFAYAQPPPPASVGYSPSPMYVDTLPAQENMPPRLGRRLSNQVPPMEKKSAKPSQSLERTVTREKRPTVVSHKSLRNLDADRAAMPPPPRPQPDMVLPHRQRPGRANTYYGNTTHNRRSMRLEDEDIPDLRPSAASKNRSTSPVKPTAFYRTPGQQDSVDRARQDRQSKSYFDGNRTVHTASSGRPEMTPRRTTMPSMSLEQKEADAVAYQQKRAGMASNDLTAEALMQYKSRHGSRSETGSTASRKSLHSSSNQSSNDRGRGLTGSAAKTNISINGINLSIPNDYHEDAAPVRIDVGGVMISMNSKDSTDERRELKRIERQPSNTGGASRRSLTNGTVVSTGSRTRDLENETMTREGMRGALRRPSFMDEPERDRYRDSAKSSRQHSRATSSGRESFDIPRQNYYIEDSTVYGA